MDGLERTKSPDGVAGYLANCLDVWHKAHPDLTVQEILTGLEEIRFKLTEALVRHP